MAQDIAQVPQQQSGSFLAAILDAATNPDIDAEKMKTMAELAVKLQDREREIEFNRAKNAAIMAMPVITKDGRIVIKDKDTGRERQQGRFARFEDIDRVVRPILETHQLALSFDIAERQGGGITVRPILTHTNGFTERGEAMPLPADQSGGKNAVQAVGSAAAYGKRYTMCAMLNIVTEAEDDDGSGGQLVGLPNESEQLVLTEATAAHEAGRYVAWFGEQGPRVRAWLIASGKHEGFGGQTALPSRRPVPPANERRDPPREEPRQPSATTGGSKPTREQRAREWVDWFKDEVRGCGSARAIEGLRTEHAGTLDTLRQAFPALYREADTAAEDKLASL